MKVSTLILLGLVVAAIASNIVVGYAGDPIDNPKPNSVPIDDPKPHLKLYGDPIDDPKPHLKLYGDPIDDPKPH